MTYPLLHAGLCGSVGPGAVTGITDRTFT